MNHHYWADMADKIKAQFAGEPQLNKIRVLAPRDGCDIAPAQRYLKHLLPEHDITFSGEGELLFYTIYRPLNQRSQFTP